MRPMCRRTVLVSIVSVAIAMVPAVANAQAYTPQQGHGSFSVAAQQLYVKYHTNWRGDRIDAGAITSNVVLLDFDYGLTDRLAMRVGLPYIRKKYVGNSPHNPDPFDDDDHDHFERIDDGDYHGGWQDWGIGLRYRWRDDPWVITPFLDYNVPSREYTFFGHAAIGTNLERIEAGVNVARRFEPPRQDWYFQGRYGYSRVEEVEGIHPDFHQLDMEVGHFFNERWSGRVLAIWRHAKNGLEFPIDYPGGGTSEIFSHHDQLNAARFVEIAVGAGYRIDDRYGVSASYLRTVWGENAHLADYAVTIAVTGTF